MRVWTLLPLLLLGLACASGPRRDADTGPLLVGSDLDNPPFAYVDDDGDPRGRDVEMMEWIATILGRELEWERMPFEELLDAAARGEVDAVCATLGITPERAERVRFSPPYFTTVQAVLVRTGPGEPADLGDLAGRPVAAGAGTTSERAARRGLLRSRLAPGAKGASGVERLLAGEVDALVVDGPAADALVELHAGRLTRLSEDLAQERYAIAMPPHRPLLARDVARAIEALRDRGLLEQLDVEYGLVR